MHLLWPPVHRKSMYILTSELKFTLGGRDWWLWCHSSTKVEWRLALYVIVNLTSVFIFCVLYISAWETDPINYSYVWCLIINLEMSSYLHSVDVYGHLISTSYANSDGDKAVQASSALDFTMTHNYGSSDIAGTTAQYVRWFSIIIIELVHGKYVLHIGTSKADDVRKTIICCWVWNWKWGKPSIPRHHQFLTPLCA